MLFKISELTDTYSLVVKEVLHIGAHKFEERLSYISAGWSPRIWIEANKAMFEQRPSFDNSEDRAIEAACWSEDGVVLDFKVMSNSECSSLLNLGLTSKYYPDVKLIDVTKVVGRRVDTLFAGTPLPNFVNIDVQGSELHVLRGFGERLWDVDYVYCEVNKRSLYLSCAQIEELDNYLLAFGLHRITTRWVPLRHWGDALYVRLESIRVRKLKLCLLMIKSAKHYVLGFLVEIVRSVILRLSQFRSNA